MKHSFHLLLVCVLFCLSPVWAEESIETITNPGGGSQTLESLTAGGQLVDIFRTVGSKIDMPKPQPKPAENNPVGVGVPEGGRSVNVLAYSYCLNGRTASGAYTRQGIVAVDPRVIPLGSKLYIPGYGWAIAADTGGAIIGNKIDVWLPSTAQCYQWGIREVTIKVFPR